MKILSLKLSNVLSFPHLEDFQKSDKTIEFKDDLNILIGPNGSGKSNLLEILFKIVQGYFFEYYYINESAINQKDGNGKIISVNVDRFSQITNTISQHNRHENTDSFVEMVIKADASDIENMLFIIRNWKELEILIQKNCENPEFVVQNKLLSIGDAESISSTTFVFRLNNSFLGEKINIGLQSPLSDPKDIFFHYYLKYFNQLQTLFEFENYFRGGNWPLLKSPIALISSMRTYSGFASGVSCGRGINDQKKSADHIDGQNSTKNYSNSDYIFRITSLRLASIFRKYRDSFGSVEGMRKMNEEEGAIIKMINELMSNAIGISLVFKDYDFLNDLAFIKLFKDGVEIDFDTLSTGQKSIFYLIFAIHGYDINHGLLIIDEPELHLHVSMQKLYFSILQRISVDANVQIIISTHSSVFINEKTINNTFRLKYERDSTKIISPKINDQSQKDLLKILTFTNSSRVFFSDSVLLVEGDSDEYFFSFFYETYFKKQFETNKKLEILYIGGKGNYRKWKDFLLLFGIDSFFIGDFDNIHEFSVLQNAGIDTVDLRRESSEYIIQKIDKNRIVAKVTEDGKALLRELDRIVTKNFEMTEEDKQVITRLWEYLVNKQGLKRNRIIGYLREKGKAELITKIYSEIEKLYSENIFILKKGDLEDYLSISKDLENVISFCRDNFNTWVVEETKKGVQNNSLAELVKIFKFIFGLA